MTRRKPTLSIVGKGPAIAPAPIPHLSSPSMRGYCVVYRKGEVNHCPGCGRSHWHIGRSTAECAFCGTAIGLPEPVHG